MTIKIYPWLERVAKQYEFDTVRITDSNLPDDTKSNLRHFIENGYHGEMKWMADSLERRLSPEKIWKSVKTAIIFAKNYGPAHNPIDDILQKNMAIFQFTLVRRITTQL